MCLEMVIICKKSVDKKSSDHVTCKSPSLGPTPAQTMSQGTALFSCGLMESSRWPDAALPCPWVQPEPALGSGLDGLWDGRPLQAAPGHCSSLSSLLRDLSLASSSEASSTAPPNKRQCRSYCSSDDLSRSSWRPQGSRVWTAVEKRRCLSGGSVQRAPPAPAAGFPSMQRSSSLSLAFPGASAPLSLRERPPSPPSSPDSAPDTERRPGSGPGLARSRSQPCVSQEKKAGVKRRRPEESGKQRPSLDLAKMTQKLRSFHSLSCPGIPSEHHCDPHLQDSPRVENSALDKLYPHNDNDDAGTKDLTGSKPFCPALPDIPTNQKEGEAMWAGRCSLYALGGELDIEQIERN